MTRSGYSTSLDDWALIRWRGAVASAVRGKRGQRLLRDLVAALDELPEPELIAESLVFEDGRVCALGAVGQARGLNLHDLDPEDWDAVAEALDIAPALAREVVFLNDEGAWDDNVWKRFKRIRKWATDNLREESTSESQN